MQITTSDCVGTMRGMPENSVDSVVTDPPYDLVGNSRNGSSQPGDMSTPYGRSGPSKKRGGFMGKEWDGTGVAFRVETWIEVLRVLKPGGYLLAFGGTRTYHRLACAIEDAGFEIRDSISWLYGSGFPKSKNVGDGWGTALKPAHEPIVMARKPLSEGTVARNVLEYGTGAINVDGCRVGGDIPTCTGQGFKTDKYSRQIGRGDTTMDDEEWNGHKQGRWPANLILSHHEDCERVGVKRVKATGPPSKTGGFNPSGGGIYGTSDGKESTAYRDPDGTEEVEAWECVEGCPVAELDRQSGVSKTGDVGVYERQNTEFYSGSNPPNNTAIHKGDKGGASRFFYVAKASRKERNAGLEGMPEQETRRYGDRNAGSLPQQTPQTTINMQNTHPTVKPIALMRYLVRMVTPPGGTVLDPFCGSGSTGCAAVLEGMDFIGIEREEEYVEIAKRRISHYQQEVEERLFAWEI